MMKQIATLMLAGCVLAANAFAVEGDAPDFTLKDIDGNEHKLADYAGKYVVLEWTNYDCPFVKKHYENGHMQELQKTLTGKGVVWLTINSSAPGKQGNYDTAEWKQRLADNGSQPTAVLLDPTGTVGKAYGASNTPHMYVIDPEGAIVYQGAIDDNPSWKGDPSEANNYVASALDAAMQGNPVEPAVTKAYGCSVKY